MSGPEPETPVRARTLTAGERDGGQRIDNFLQRVLRDVPRSRIYRLLRRGEVRVNARRVKATYRLMPGDRVRIPPVRESVRPPGPAVPAAALEAIDQAVLYEDEDLLILNKPAGMAVHGGSGLAYGLIDALRGSRPNAPFLELVHRLDRDTSGCLMVAKSRKTLTGLQGMLRSGEIRKYYLALLRGAWQGGSREVEMRLGRRAVRAGERVVTVDPEAGRIARSRFAPREPLGVATLMGIEIDTGRTHQIRVQAAELGHPVAGDDKYGDRAFNRRMRTLGLKRQFLHAWRLELRHPRSGRAMTVEAALTPEQQRVLDRLRGEARNS
jgi:23S rRNA pseudouridine955/2504/2580 synthase